MNIEDERKTFQAWCAEKGYETMLDYKREGYAYHDTNNAWTGWLARARLDTNPPKEDGE